MYNINQKGRPSLGEQSRSVSRAIRIEPYLNDMLVEACSRLHISCSEALRQGLILFLKEADKAINDPHSF